MYNKLFSKIVDSSIWLEPTPTRIVWLMFIAVMNEDGFVQFASVANVAHRARITDEEAEQAIKILEGPDPNSADEENDGRRIEKVPGGWMILNAGKYRDLVTREMQRDSTRERVRRHRQTKRVINDKVIAGQKDCECCGNPFEEPFSKYVVLDHNHKTLTMRGLICQSCNKVVGLIESSMTYKGEKRAVAEAYIARYEQRVTPVKRTCNGLVTPSDTDTETKKERSAKGSRPQSVEDWLKELEADKTYQGIDVRREYGKMLNWSKLRSKKPTQRRFVNWLNNAEKTLPAQHASRPDYKRNYLPPARELSDEEFEAQRKIALAETKRAKEAIRNG